MLTQRQQQILDFVTDYYREHEISPSLEEIKSHFSLSSVSTIHQHLEAIKTKGYLQKIKNKARAIRPYEDTNTKIPLLGLIAAGEPIEAVENPEPVDVPASMIDNSGYRFYALRVKGKSMINDGILERDIIVVREQEDVDNGDIAVAIIDDNKATLKRIYKEKSRIKLQPANDRMKPFYRRDAEIRGKVVGVVRWVG